MQMIGAPILGRISDRFGRRPVFLISILGTFIGFLILGLANSLWMLFASRILSGLTAGNISVAQAYIADVTTPENRAKGMGLIGAAFGLGFVFGPAIGGVMSRWGIHVPFLFAGALAFANAVLVAPRQDDRHARFRRQRFEDAECRAIGEDEVREQRIDRLLRRARSRLLARVRANDVPAAGDKRHLEQRRSFAVVKDGEHDRARRR